jgi:prepilin-type N-terminal cleavage/methylation domain-containing protein
MAGGRPGFSLLELLAVMAIMSMLTTLAVSSYFAAIRGMTRRSAVKHFANTLILARQRACMEGAFVSVVIYNEITGVKDTDVTPSYVICKEIGRVTYLGGSDKVIDEYTEIDRLFGTKSYGQNFRGSIRLYNLTQGKWWNVYPWVEAYTMPKRNSAYKPTPSPTIEFNAFAFEKNENVNNLNEATWEIGDAYGIEAAPTGSLPHNFQFAALGDSASQVITITFKPDGSAVFRPSGTVRIIETQAQQRANTVTVTSDGVIDFNDKW